MSAKYVVIFKYMKLKLEEIEGEEPCIKTLAIPVGENFHTRYYRVLHSLATKKNSKLHKLARQRLKALLDEVEELMAKTA